MKYVGERDNLEDGDLLQLSRCLRWHLPDVKHINVLLQHHVNDGCCSIRILYAELADCHIKQQHIV